MEATKQLDPEQKKVLLKRKFTSLAYAEAFRDHFAAALAGMKAAIAWFYAHPPEEDWEAWPVWDRPESWEGRAVPNFEGELAGIEEGLRNYRRGDASTLASSAGSIKGISRGLAEMGEGWLNYVREVAPEVARAYHGPLAQAIQHAVNIYYTLRERWLNDNILKERITGPVDEADLLRYLEEGEQPRWQ